MCTILDNSLLYLYDLKFDFSNEFLCNSLQNKQKKIVTMKVINRGQHFSNGLSLM